MGYKSTLHSFSDSLSRLDSDYIDLYLIHWPGNSAKARQETWMALEEIQKSGRAKHIGVSNYHLDHLRELVSYAKVKPFANQIEFHPFIFGKQKPILNFCHKNGIAIEAYSPLAQANKLTDKTIMAIAAKHNVSPAQVMLRWAIQHGTTPIPRSSNPERIKQNLEINSLKLSEQEVKRLDNLSDGQSALHWRYRIGLRLISLFKKR